MTAAPPAPATERILDATIVALSQYGARKLSMSDVAAIAGVSRPTLYRYYQTKDDLLGALARHEQRRFVDGLAAAIGAVRSASDRLDAALHYIVGFLDDYAPRRLVELEPGFVLDRLAQLLPAQRDTLDRLLGDALANSPPVRAGKVSTTGVSELLLRVAMSHYLLPHPDPDELLRTLQALLGGRAKGAPRARR